jgi:hypothetical protein
LVIAKAGQGFPSETLQTLALICCDFHQSAVATFIAHSRVIDLRLVYAFDLAGDRGAHPTRSRFSSAWHGDCLNQSVSGSQKELKIKTALRRGDL